MSEDKYLVAGCTPWARRVFDERLSKLPGEWRFVSSPQEMAVELVTRYVFFIHWRWKVPRESLAVCECIGFHIGNLVTQRGGTPLQHRVLSGASEAKLVMFKLTDEMDAGPVYTMRTIPLHGAAEAIYARAMDAAADMIEVFVKYPYKPRDVPPMERAAPFPRRTPDQSRLPASPSPNTLGRYYDYIRALDAEGYPHAFLDYGDYRFTFRRAVLYDGRIEADVTITPLEQDSE